jgi:hypothetical protein
VTYHAPLAMHCTLQVSHCEMTQVRHVHSQALYLVFLPLNDAGVLINEVKEFIWVKLIITFITFTIAYL